MVMKYRLCLALAAAACGSESASAPVAVDTQESIDVAEPFVVPDPPADGRWTHTFLRGVPGTLVVYDVASPLYGFRLTLDGDEFETETLTVTVSAGEAFPGAATPTVVLEPHGTVFSRPAEVRIPFAALPTAETSDAERLVVLRRRATEAGATELVPDTLAYAHHTVSGWYQIAPMALRPGPSPVEWEPAAMGRNGPIGLTLDYPNLLATETLGFSTISGAYAARNRRQTETEQLRGIACSTDADCHDGMPCSTDKCEPFEGGAQCTWTWAPQGSTCDDGDPATVGDACRKYRCTGQERECSRDSDCDDGDLCTGETCDDGVCKSLAEPDGGACISGVGAPGRCEGGACREDQCSVDADCDDQNACSADRCDAGLCAHVAADGACDDGNAATDGDTCSYGQCVGVVTVCDPKATICPGSGGCATMTCATSGGTGYCTAKASVDGAACDDGNAATAGDVCSAGTCRGKSSDCTCAEGTLTALPGCTWGDATECSGWVSALCYEECGGFANQTCFTDCHVGVEERRFASGTKYTAEECTITLDCP